MSESRRELKPAKPLEIDPKLLAEFAAVPDSHIGGPTVIWNDQRDTLLLTFWPHKNKTAFAKKLGVNETTVRERYRKLLAEQPERAAALAEEGRKLCSR